jgi:hypothetical protein
VGRYIAGQTVEVEFAFEDGEDPDTVEAFLRRPDGTESALAVDPGDPDDGIFTVSYPVVDTDPPGDYRVRLTGTGGIRGAAVHVFHVDDDGFAPQ